MDSRPLETQKGDDRVQRRKLDRDPFGIDAKSSAHVNASEADALLWLELAEGSARDALIERLAQAHLTVPKAERLTDRQRRRMFEEL